jgi:hypothetical protein
MAGGSAQHLAQRRHRRADHAGRGPLLGRARRGDLRGHRRDRWLGRGGAVSRDLRGHRRDRWLWRGGAVKGWARPGGGRTRIRVGRGWFGHGVFPWQVGPAAASSATAGWRPAGTLRRRMGGRAAASRRRAGPASAAGGRGPGRPLSRWPCGGHRRVHASRTACGVRAGALRRDGQRQRQAGPEQAAPRPRRGWRSSRHGRCRARIGPAASIRHRHRRPGRGIASVVGTSDGDDRAGAHRSSGSPGKLAAGGGRRPVPEATLYPHRETSKFFPESGNLSRWPAGPS